MGASRLQSIHVKSFRCFDHFEIDLTAPFILIEGDNGSGKSSLVEALHYACYLKSFRTSSARQLAKLGLPGFFVQLNFHDPETDITHDLSVGFSDGDKSVLLDTEKVKSYKDVLSHYRVVTMAEHDLNLVQEGPEYRRVFTNQFLLLLEPGITEHFKTYRHVLQQKNKCLLAHHYRTDQAIEQLEVWNRQLWGLSQIIGKKRSDVLQILETRVNNLLEQLGHPARVSLKYSRKKWRGESFAEFWDNYLAAGDFEKELQHKRSLFGVHVDDVNISFADKNARLYASRGQQKLLVLLLKIAQMQELQDRFVEGSRILLLDDFVTDFDQAIMSKLLELISSLSCQVIITCPLFEQVVFPKELSVQRIRLS